MLTWLVWEPCWEVMSPWPHHFLLRLLSSSLNFLLLILTLFFTSLPDLRSERRKKKNPFWLWIAQRINVEILHETCKTLSYPVPTFFSSLVYCLADSVPDCLAVLIAKSFLCFVLCICCSLFLPCCESLSSLIDPCVSLETTEKHLLTEALPLHLQVGTGISPPCFLPHDHYHMMIPACSSTSSTSLWASWRARTKYFIFKATIQCGT